MLSTSRRLPSLLAFTSLVVTLSTSLQAQAALVNYSSAGVDLYYSSISDVSWTQNANLLGSLISNNGYSTVVDAIINANSGVSYGSTPYTLSSSDFSNVGETSWWGAQAFVHYLNTVNYAGSNEWRLPTVADIGNDGCDGNDCGYNSSTNGTTAGDEFAELYYKELGLPPFGGVHSSGYGIGSPFSQVQSFYWTGTEVVNSGDGAFEFFATYGFQQVYPKDATVWYAWAVTPGAIIPVNVPSAVPEPYSASLLLAGLSILLFRSYKQVIPVGKLK
jgi:hypothetical protein